MTSGLRGSARASAAISARDIGISGQSVPNNILFYKTVFPK
jgi:hypothetical protein